MTYQQWKTTPIKGSPYLSIIIPAYNEEARILPTIQAISQYASDQGFDWELLISDDGSQDRTIELVESLHMANLRVIRARKNEGKGNAVRSGILAARGQYILFADADNSTPPQEMSPLLKILEQGHFDVAIGSRAAIGATEASRPVFRRILSGGLRMIVKYGLRFNISDTQCGFKMYTREAAKRLHTAQTMKGFSFDLEVLYLAAKLDYKIAEIPVQWVDAPGSKVDGAKETRRFIRDLAMIKVNDLRGVYAYA
jgi:dolichyl-phosphate beta-glucosyltransferase